MAQDHWDEAEAQKRDEAQARRLEEVEADTLRAGHCVMEEARTFWKVDSVTSTKAGKHGSVKYIVSGKNVETGAPCTRTYTHHARVIISADSF